MQLMSAKDIYSKIHNKSKSQQVHTQTDHLEKTFHQDQAGCNESAHKTIALQITFKKKQNIWLKWHVFIACKTEFGCFVILVKTFDFSELMSLADKDKENEQSTCKEPVKVFDMIAEFPMKCCVAMFLCHFEALLACVNFGKT